jgi:hypothetical protein
MSTIGYKSNCTVIIDSKDNHVIDIVSDYDIAYRDLINKGLCERPSYTLRAYLTNNGRLQAPRVRFTRRDNGREYYAKQF